MILAEDIGTIVGIGIIISIVVAFGLIFLVNTFVKKWLGDATNYTFSNDIHCGYHSCIYTVRQFNWLFVGINDITVRYIETG
jgi:hypothetical protein